MIPFSALAMASSAFLPNPVLTIDLPDLTGAVRAELILDRWGGHPGTSNKRVRFNGASWLHLPEPPVLDEPVSAGGSKGAQNAGTMRRN